MFSADLIRRTLRQALLASIGIVVSTVPTIVQGQHEHASPSGTNAEKLGEMLLAVSQPADALREFEASLRVAPNRYRSIAGAAKAAESIGDRQAARVWYERLLQLTADADTERPEITAARTFMTKN